MINIADKTLKAELLLLTCALVWGASFIIVKNGVSSTPVFSYIFYRYVLATIACLLFFNKRIKVTKGSLLLGIVLGLCFYFGYALEATGLRGTDSSMAGFIIGLNVVIVPALYFLLFRVKAKSIVLISAVLSLFGLYLMSMTNGMHLTISEVYILLFAVMISLHIVLTGRYAFSYNLYGLLFVQFGTICVLSLITSLVYEKATFSIDFNRGLIVAIVYNGLLSTFYCFAIQTFMQRYLSPARVAIIFMSEPIFAMVLGTSFGGDTYDGLQIFGSFLVLIAILITTVRKRKRIN